MESLQQSIASFNSYHNLSDAFSISSLAKEILTSLKRHLETSRTINDQQEYIGVQKFDFSKLDVMIDEFDKFHNLWNFAEKWRYVRTKIRIVFNSQKKRSYF